MSESRRVLASNPSSWASVAAGDRSPRAARRDDPALMRFPERERAEIAELLDLLSAKPAAAAAEAAVD